MSSILDIDDLLTIVFDGIGQIRQLRKVLDQEMCDGWIDLDEANRSGRIHHVEFNSSCGRSRSELKSAYRILHLNLKQKGNPSSSSSSCLNENDPELSTTSTLSSTCTPDELIKGLRSSAPWSLVDLDDIYQQALEVIQRPTTSIPHDNEKEDDDRDENDEDNVAHRSDNDKPSTQLRHRGKKPATPNVSSTSSSSSSSSTSSSSTMVDTKTGPKHAYDTDHRRRFKTLPELPPVIDVMNQIKSIREKEQGTLRNKADKDEAKNETSNTNTNSSTKGSDALDDTDSDGIENMKVDLDSLPPSLLVGFDDKATRFQWAGPVPVPQMLTAMNHLKKAVGLTVRIAQIQRNVTLALDELERRGVTLSMNGGRKEGSKEGDKADKVDNVSVSSSGAAKGNDDGSENEDEDDDCDEGSTINTNQRKPFKPSNTLTS